jgi:hypothetical protein
MTLLDLFTGIVYGVPARGQTYELLYARFGGRMVTGVKTIIWISNSSHVCMVMFVVPGVTHCHLTCPCHMSRWQENVAEAEFE